jgi:predicted amidohydrolase
MKNFLAAAIQMTSGDDIAANIAQAEPLVAQAAKAGAAFVALPENAFYMRREGTATVQDVSMTDHAGIHWAQGAAKQHRIWLLVGSIRALETGDKPYNRSVLIGLDGAIVAHYDKLHLFDVTLPDGQQYLESSQAMAGQQPVVVKTALGSIGLSICYDLRFAPLYRALALAGAEMLTVPSAFTKPTGQAHWHALLRARAIENACYVVAPAQAGMHPGGRETYGHALIVNPWGEIIAEAAGDTPQVVLAEIDRARVAQVRAQIPVLTHHRALADVKVVGV